MSEHDHDPGLALAPELGEEPGHEGGEGEQEQLLREPEQGAKRKKKAPGFPFAHRSPIGVARWKRETRFGVAALLSFVILVTVLLINKQRGKGKDDAEDARPNRPLAMELPPPKTSSDDPSESTPKPTPTPDQDQKSDQGTDSPPPPSKPAAEFPAPVPAPVPLPDDKLREAGNESAPLPPIEQDGDPTFPPLAGAGAPETPPSDELKGVEPEFPVPVGSTATTGEPKKEASPPPEPAPVPDPAPAQQPGESVAQPQLPPGEPTAPAATDPAAQAEPQEMPGPTDLAGPAEPQGMPGPAELAPQPESQAGPGPDDLAAPAEAQKMPEAANLAGPTEPQGMPGPADAAVPPAQPTDGKSSELVIPGGEPTAEPGNMPVPNVEQPAAPADLPAPNEPSAPTNTPAPAPAEAPTLSQTPISPEAEAPTQPPTSVSPQAQTPQAQTPQAQTPQAKMPATTVGPDEVPIFDRAPASGDSRIVSPAPPDIKPGEGIPIPNAGKGQSLDEDGPAKVTSAVAATPISSAASAVDSESAIVRVHVVESGENFWTISRRYYSSGRYYMALWKANSRSVSKPEQLMVGQRIVIPAPEALDRNSILPPQVSGSSPSSSASSPRVTAPVRRTSRSKPNGDDSADTPVQRSSEVELILPIDNSMLDRRRRSQASEALDPPPEQRPQVSRPRYRVRSSDETLRIIARETLNDSRRAEEIYELNRDILSSPRARLIEGQILELPDDARVDRRSRRPASSRW